jgi:hypothetical protein
MSSGSKTLGPSKRIESVTNTCILHPDPDISDDTEWSVATSSLLDTLLTQLQDVSGVGEGADIPNLFSVPDEERTL